MAKAEIEKVIDVDRAWAWKAITDYASYPKFVKGCSRVEVSRESPSSATVAYKVNLVKEVEYVLRHSEDEAKGVVSWQLVSSAFMKKNAGRWVLADAGPGKTKAHYELEIEFSFPAPGFVVSGLIKSSLPQLVTDIEAHARALQAKGGSA